MNASTIAVLSMFTGCVLSIAAMVNLSAELDEARAEVCVQLEARRHLAELHRDDNVFNQFELPGIDRTMGRFNCPELP